MPCQEERCWSSRFVPLVLQILPSGLGSPNSGHRMTLRPRADVFLARTSAICSSVKPCTEPRRCLRILIPVKTVQSGIGQVLSAASTDVSARLRATRPEWPCLCEGAGSLFPAAAPYRFLNGGSHPPRSLLSTLSGDNNPCPEHRHQTLTLRSLPSGVSMPRLPLANRKAEVSEHSRRPQTPTRHWLNLSEGRSIRCREVSTVS